MDAYCRMLMLAKQLGGVHFLGEQKSRELLELKDNWGFADPRNTQEYEDCDICANDIFRESWKDAGVERKAFDAPPAIASGDSSPVAGGVDQEALVKAITDRVMQELGQRVR